jgi:hypothetical protein
MREVARGFRIHDVHGAGEDVPHVARAGDVHLLHLVDVEGGEVILQVATQLLAVLQAAEETGLRGFRFGRAEKTAARSDIETGQEENREGTGQDRETRGLPRGRDREVTARRERGVATRAALDRIAGVKRNLDARSRSGKTPARVTTIDRIDARAIPSAPNVGSASIARGHSRRAEHLVRVSSTPVARVRVRSPVCARREACAVGCARARGAPFQNQSADKQSVFGFFR